MNLRMSLMVLQKLPNAVVFDDVGKAQIQKQIPELVYKLYKSILSHGAPIGVFGVL